MSVDEADQQFEAWLREWRRAIGLRTLNYSGDTVRAAWTAGAESQHARIVELEAERDRLLAIAENADERIRDILDVLTDFTAMKVDSSVKVRVATDRLNALLPVITSNEESRG